MDNTTFSSVLILFLEAILASDVYNNLNSLNRNIWEQWAYCYFIKVTLSSYLQLLVHLLLQVGPPEISSSMSGEQGESFWAPSPVDFHTSENIQSVSPLPSSFAHVVVNFLKFVSLQFYRPFFCINIPLWLPSCLVWLFCQLFYMCKVLAT